MYHQNLSKGRRLVNLGGLVLRFLVLLGLAPAALAQTPTGTVKVYYVGPADAVAQAIERVAPYVTLVERPEMAQVFVLNDTQLDPAQLRGIERQVLREEVGLVVFAGPAFPQSTGDLRALLGVGMCGLAGGRSAPRALATSDEPDPLQKSLAWGSAPPLSARTVISNPNLLLPIVETTAGEPVIQRVRGREQTQVFIVGGWLGDASNEQWVHWPYFDYLIYRLLTEAAGAQRVLSVADVPFSPVPHGNIRLGIIGGGVIVALCGFLALFLARRSLFLHPEQVEWLRAPAVSPAEVPAGPWQQVGFHRPLAGFLFLLGSGLLLFVPWLLYQTRFLPEVLIPWPQILDFWGQAVRWLEIAWLLFDMGTGIAAVRYFATLRPHNPCEGWRYFQFYVWWQLLSGALQLGVVAWLAVWVFPHTAWAHLSFYFLACALVRFPGFLQVFRLFFQALQRLDYEQLLTVILVGGPLFFQTAMVLGLRRWGGAHPEIGETLGSVLGLGLGWYVTTWVAFLVGAHLYRRLGYALKPLFLPAFDSHIAGRVLSFGARLTFGSVAVLLGYAAQVTLLAQWLPASTALQGDWATALKLVYAYEVLSTGLYDDLLPALVEAHTVGHHTLLRYYMSQGLRYGLGVSLFILAVLAAVGDRFILGALGPSHTGATHWIGLLALWGAWQWLGWSAGRVLEAVGRPALRSWLLVGEQVVRLGLAALLVPQWQLWGVWMAWFLATLLRGLVAWLLVARHVGRPHLPFWPAVIAPGGAALLLYAFLRGLGDMFWQPAPAATFWLLGVTLLIAPPAFGCCTAILGGWDDEGLAELRQAVFLSGLGLPAAWVFYQGVRLGAGISPLHGRFPLASRAAALDEAATLTLRTPQIPEASTSG